MFLSLQCSSVLIVENQGRYQPWYAPYIISKHLSSPKIQTLWRTTQVPQTQMYLKYILIMLKFHNRYNINLWIFFIFFFSSSFLSSLYLETYCTIMSCKVFYIKAQDTAIEGKPREGWSLMASLWRTANRCCQGQGWEKGLMGLIRGHMVQMCCK